MCGPLGCMARLGLGWPMLALSFIYEGLEATHWDHMAMGPMTSNHHPGRGRIPGALSLSDTCH